MRDVFEYDFTRDEQLLVHAIKYAVAVNAELKAQPADVISPLLIYVNLIEKTVDFRCEIDFPKLVTLTEKAVEMSCAEFARINTVQGEPIPEIARGVEIVHKIDVRAVLQDAGGEFYDFLVECCR